MDKDKKRKDKYNADRSHHILGASANLLGICLVVITGLKISNSSAETYADEVCFFALFALLSSCLFSYLSIRKISTKYDYESWADYSFISAIFSLFIAMVVVMFNW